MAYVNAAKVVARSDALTGQTDLAEAIAFAEGIIDGRLSLVPRFTVPFTDGAVPKIVQGIAADLACAFQLAKLYEQSGADDPLKGSLYFERRALEQLDRLADGKASTPSASVSDLPAASVVTDVSATARRPVLRDFDLVNAPETCGQPPFGRFRRGGVR